MLELQNVRRRRVDRTIREPQMCAVLVVVVALMALMDLAQAVPHPDPAANPDPQFEALHRTLSRGLARSLVHIRNLLH